jgi:hypothetical protein
VSRLLAAGDPGIGFVEFSLIFFMVLFVAIVVRLALSRTDRWRKDARIPLEDMPATHPDRAGTAEGARHDVP